MYQITLEGYRLRVSKEELVQKEAQEQAKLVHAMADPWNALLNAIEIEPVSEKQSRRS